MTTLIGRCMRLVAVLSQPLTARGTDIWPLPTPLLKRFVCQKWNFLDYFTEFVVDFKLLNSSWMVSTGDKESVDKWRGLAALELEVWWGPNAERSLLHFIWPWSFGRLCQSLQLSSQVLFISGIPYLWCWGPFLPQRAPMLIGSKVHLLKEYTAVIIKLNMYPILSFRKSY